jgi:sortase A
MTVITIILTCISFAIFNHIFQNISNAYSEKKPSTINETVIEPKKEDTSFVKEVSEVEIKQKEEESKITKIEKTKHTSIVETNTKKVWQLEIPRLNLIAPISNGTTEKVMNKYVGHFENTSKLNGNIGLAAHNRGYPVNYFKNIKNLRNGDEIVYKYNNETKKYIINKAVIITETDWSYLEPTKDNRITLITCVENKPKLRRVVQGYETKK